MTKSSHPFPKGVALLITDDGNVMEVLHDTVGLFPNESESGSSFIYCLESDSVEKSRRFIEKIIDNGVAYDWELHIEKQNYTSLFNFSGVRTEEGIVLIGSQDPNDYE